jgi:hypothetical protein
MTEEEEGKKHKSVTKRMKCLAMYVMKIENE